MAYPVPAIQVQVSAEEHDAFRARAHELGTSMSKLGYDIIFANPSTCDCETDAAILREYNALPITIPRDPTFARFAILVPEAMEDCDRGRCRACARFLATFAPDLVLADDLFCVADGRTIEDLEEEYRNRTDEEETHATRP